MIACNIDSPKVYDYNRLMGGADVSEEPQPETKPTDAFPKLDPQISQPPSLSPPIGNVEAKDPGNKQPLPGSGPCCVCIAQTPGLVGDRKVDEIIEYVHQNLEEAVKALATLSENFEHDLKLMFVDILGRIKQWSGIVQNKLGTCKNEVNNLSKELLARTCEVADLKVQIADYQNKITPKRKDKMRTKDQLKVSEKRDDIKRTLKEGKEYDDIGEDEEEDLQKISEMRNEEIEDERDEIDEERDETEEKRPARKIKIKEDISTTVSVQTTAQEKERTRRESELQTEISQLRKENDRIMKERAEYENAIQRALLRGVSSLNVEALRVLRCPPIPCCAPCVPCPATTIVPPEPVVPCPARNPKRILESAAPTICNNKVSKNRDIRNGNQICNTIKRSCGRSCCSAIPARGRKLTDSNMFLLLRQSDAGNLQGPDESTMTVCETPFTRNVEVPLLPRCET